MYRRQVYDRLDPRDVVPSRHTLFVRGLPGSTDVSKVREFFSNQTGSKCSIEFFSTSEDRKRFSVAIRFKTHDMAREILARYNSKSLFGYPVELTWFKDLKKARQQIFGDQRQGNRQYQRNSYRPLMRSGQERRSMHSMGAYGNTRRRARGSSSSCGSDARRYRDIDRNHGSMSRSRSYTGSSSRSISRSRGSRSRSCSKNRASLVSNRNDSPRVREVEFTNRSYDRSRPLRNRFDQSRDHSICSSHSSNAQRRNSFCSNNKDQTSRFNHCGTNSPSHYASQGRHYSGSPMDGRNFSAFTNAVAPDDVNGSLVSGFIESNYQSKQREKSQTLDQNFNQSSRRSRSSSVDSVASSSRNVVTMSRNRSPHKHRHHSNSSSLTGSVSHQQFRSQQNEDDNKKHDINNDLAKRKKSKQVFRPRDSPSSDDNRTGSRFVSLESPDGGNHHEVSPPHTPGIDEAVIRKSMQQEEIVQKRRFIIKSNRKPITESLIFNKNDSKTSSQSPQPLLDRNKRCQPIQDDNELELIETGNGDKKAEKLEEKKAKRKCTSDVEKNVVNEDLVDLLQSRKDVLTQDYKKDCEAFMRVVRTLISKDEDLENRLMPMVKEILYERGQRCIEDLRSFIAEHQSEMVKQIFNTD